MERREGRKKTKGGERERGKDIYLKTFGKKRESKCFTSINYFYVP